MKKKYGKAFYHSEITFNILKAIKKRAHNDTSIQDNITQGNIDEEQLASAFETVHSIDQGLNVL